MLIFCQTRTSRVNIVKYTGREYGEDQVLNITVLSLIREEGEGNHVSISHSVANTDPKRQVFSK